MAVFCKLADPEGYRACDWDLLRDAPAREAWIDIFDHHTDSLIEHARSRDVPPTESAIAAYRAAFTDALNQIRRNPNICDRLDIYALCKLRADMLREYAMGDPYERVKQVENDAALRHLPAWLNAIDNRDELSVIETLFRGILAGNKFDLGAKATTDQHGQGGIDFFDTLGQLTPRPWFRDDLDRLTPLLRPGRCAYRSCMFFIDNSGADVVLGAIPIARYLASQNCRVILAANDEPSLNDVTVTELNDLLRRVAEMDDRVAQLLQSERITTVGTGCDCPLIDLSDVCDACNEAARGCELVILEGMGRAIETNYHIPFNCDAIHLAMIKNPHVARWIGCEMFDLIARFTPANSPPPPR